MSSRSRFVPAIIGVAAAVLLAGCSAKPENSPVIRKKFAEVDDMKGQVDETARLARSMNADMAIIKDQLSNLRALTPDENGVVEVMKRLEQMESRLSSMEKGATPNMIATASNRSTPATTSAPATTTNDSTKSSTNFGGLAVPEGAENDPITDVIASANTTKPAPAPKAETTKTTTPKVEQVSTKSAKSEPKAATTKSTTKTATKPTTTKSTTASKSTNRGSYYVLQTGDSLEKVARESGVSVGDLRKANSLPEGARVLKGQRLFIPAKG